jgi:hypothetical protein
MSSPPNILTRRHGAQVSRVDACGIVCDRPEIRAEMSALQTVRDRSDTFLVHHAMCAIHSTMPNPDEAVSATTVTREFNASVRTHNAHAQNADYGIDRDTRTPATRALVLTMARATIALAIGADASVRRIVSVTLRALRLVCVPHRSRLEDHKGGTPDHHRRRKDATKRLTTQSAH